MENFEILSPECAELTYEDIRGSMRGSDVSEAGECWRKLWTPYHEKNNTDRSSPNSSRNHANALEGLKRNITDIKAAVNQGHSPDMLADSFASLKTPEQKASKTTNRQQHTNDSVKYSARQIINLATRARNEQKLKGEISQDLVSQLMRQVQGDRTITELPGIAGVTLDTDRTPKAASKAAEATRNGARVMDLQTRLNCSQAETRNLKDQVESCNEQINLLKDVVAESHLLLQDMHRRWQDDQVEPRSISTRAQSGAFSELRLPETNACTQTEDDDRDHLVDQIEENIRIFEILKEKLHEKDAAVEERDRELDDLREENGQLRQALTAFINKNVK